MNDIIINSQYKYWPGLYRFLENNYPSLSIDVQPLEDSGVIQVHECDAKLTQRLNYLSVVYCNLKENSDIKVQLNGLKEEELIALWINQPLNKS